MKKILFLIFLPVIVTAQEFTIESDYDREAELDRYSQYYWMMDDQLGDNLWINLNTLKSALIKDAIEYQMDLLDYEKNVDDPDFLVNFFVFNEGYKENPLKEFYNEEDEFPNINLDAITGGTLVLSFIDTKSNRTVWLGYAAEVINEQNQENLRDQQKSIRKAVSRLMSVYQDALNNP